jgi:hypothetical protein
MGEHNSNRQLLRRKADSLSELETDQVLDYIEMIESMREARAEPSDDDIVNSLSEATENRRARIVMEWDKVRRRADTRASNFTLSRKAY